MMTKFKAMLIAALFTTTASQLFGQVTPWWKHHQTLTKEVDHSDISNILNTNSSMYLGILADNGNGLNDALDQKYLVSAGLIPALNDLGLKNIAFQHSSVMGGFVVEIDTSTFEILATIFTGLSGTGKRVWYGFRSFYDGEPWMKYAKYSDYFDSKWLYPDGRQVLDPYDLAGKNLEGEKNFWFTSVDANNDTLARQYQMDICNPFLLEYKKEEIKFLIDEGIDGFWLDEYDVDNLIGSGAEFGDWSRFLFKEYLRENFDQAELAMMGITNPDSFDIVEYIKGTHRPIESEEWIEDLVWLSYVLFKTETKTRFNEELVGFAKEYGATLGKEILVTGNAWPLHPNTGISHQYLDIPFHELNSHSYLVPGAPLDFPPTQKQKSAIAKLSTTLSDAPYAIFTPTSFPQQYWNRSGLYEIQMADLMGNRGIFAYQDDFFPLDKAAHIHAFIHNNQSLFDGREPLAEVALVYSYKSNSALTDFGGGGAWAGGPNQNPEFLGWAKALTNLHIQWSVLPSYNINSVSLSSQYQAIILPSTLVLSDEDVTLLEQFVITGGALIVVGESSIRDHRLWPRSDYALSVLTGVHWGSEPNESLINVGEGKVTYIKDLVGTSYHFYRDDGARMTIGNALNSSLPFRLINTTASDTIGINLYWQENHRRLLVNLNNYNIDVASDVITPAESIYVKLKLPQQLMGQPLRAFSASWDAPLSQISITQPDDSTAAFILPHLRTFVAVGISYNNPPVLAEIENQAVQEGNTLEFTIRASDIEGDEVVFSATGLPENAALDASTGEFIFAPETGQTGIFDVTFIATDSHQGSDSLKIAISVYSSEVTNLAFHNGRFYDQGNPLWMRGVMYYQPHAFHQDFWKLLDMPLLERDLRRIRVSGFNTLTIEISWGSFVNTVFEDGTSDWNFDTEQMFIRLLETAVNEGLYINLWVTNSRAPIGVDANSFDGSIDLDGVSHEAFRGYPIPCLQAGLVDSNRVWLSFMDFIERLSSITSNYYNVIWDPLDWQYLSLSPLEWDDLCNLEIWRSWLQSHNNDIGYWNTRWGEDNSDFTSVLFPVNSEVRAALGNLSGNLYFGMSEIPYENEKWNDFREWQDEMLSMAIQTITTKIRSRHPNAIIGQRIDERRYGDFRQNTWGPGSVDFLFISYAPNSSDQVSTAKQYIADLLAMVREKDWHTPKLALFLLDSGADVSSFFPGAGDQFRLQIQKEYIVDIFEAGQENSELGMITGIWRDTYFDSTEIELGLNSIKDLPKPSLEKLMDVFDGNGYEVSFPRMTFSLSFENGFTDIFDDSPNEVAQAVSLTDGIAGQGAEIPINGLLAYPTNANFDKRRGSLEMWVKPNWNFDPTHSTRTHNLFYWGAFGFQDELRLWVWNQWVLEDRWLAAGVEVGNGYEVTGWVSGEWHHIAATWDNSTGEARLYADSTLLGINTNFTSPNGESSYFWLGSDWDGVIDEVRIYNYAVDFSSRPYESETVEISDANRDFYFLSSNGDALAIMNFNSENLNSVTVEAYPNTFPPNRTDDQRTVKRYYIITADPANTSFNARISLFYKQQEFVDSGIAFEDSLKLYSLEGDHWVLQGGYADVNKNKVTLSNVTAFSAWAFSDPGDRPVAVRLISFEVEIDHNVVALDWVPVSDTDIMGYEIQRSSKDSSNFVKIGSVKRKNSADSIHGYRLIDRDLSVGTYYYRLKQINIDGSFEYSSILQVTIGLPVSYELWQNYPNPFNPETKIKYQLPKSTDVKLEIYNIMGQKVVTLIDEKQQAGYHSVKWDGTNDFGIRVATGIYVYRLGTKEFVKARKLTLLR